MNNVLKENFYFPSTTNGQQYQEKNSFSGQASKIVNCEVCPHSVGPNNIPHYLHTFLFCCLPVTFIICTSTDWTLLEDKYQLSNEMLYNNLLKV